LISYCDRSCLAGRVPAASEAARCYVQHVESLLVELILIGPDRDEAIVRSDQFGG